MEAEKGQHSITRLTSRPKKYLLLLYVLTEASQTIEGTPVKGNRREAGQAPDSGDEFKIVVAVGEMGV